MSGFLDLGTAISGSGIVTPPDGTGYVSQPVSFDPVPGGYSLNGISCIFGPVSGSWGTLTVFGLSDSDGNLLWPGTLSSPFSPVNGQLVIVPQGNLSLVYGSQFVAAPSNIVTISPQKGPTASGSVALTSGAYSLVLASGARNVVLLTNAAQSDIIKIILGGITPPASGAFGYGLIAGYESWPPAGMGSFVPTDSIWALSGAASGTVLNYITG